MPYCSVLSCRHQSRFNNLSSGGISYHRFPHDPHLKEKWIDATGRQIWMPTKLSTICSQHFDSDCFIVKQSGNRYLSEKALPTLNFVKFYAGNQAPVKEEPSSDSDSCEEETSSIAGINGETKIEPETGTDSSYTCTYSTCTSTSSTDKFAQSPNDTPQEQKLKSMLRGKTELVKRQKLKIKQLQAKLRRLNCRYAIVEGELKQRKKEDNQMGISREKYVHREIKNKTISNKHKEIEFVRV